MKKLMNIALVIIAFIVLIFWMDLSDFEAGKYDSFQEAIDKGIPYEVNDIIHTERNDGVTIVLYTTNTNKEELPLAYYGALGVAFFQGDSEDGWENIGQHGWQHYENDNMTVYIESLREHDKVGDALHDFYIVFGEINNAEITKVETKRTDENLFEVAKVIKHKGNRYYLQIGRETIVRGLSKEGEVIDRQGG